MKSYLSFILFLIFVWGCQSPKTETQEGETSENEMIYKKDSTGYDLPVVSIEVAHPLEGAKNFRIPAYSVMPAGRVYRSDALHELTEADIRYLDSLGIKTIIDLRNEEEVADEPDRNIPSVVNMLYFPVRRDKNKNEEIPDSLYSEFRQMFFDQRYDEVARIMDSLGLDIPAGRIERYRSFALNHREAYSKFMKALADSSIYPVVFHCQGGKDRAGFASAILGRTLGATHEEIMQDYLTTNLHNYEGLKQMQKVPPAIKSIIGAHAEQMEAAFAAIDEEYGGFENYLSEGLSLTEADLAAIRENLR